MSDILKVLSPVAILAIIWSIIQFYEKRKHEKNDKKKELKLKILTEFLTEINDLRVLSTDIFNHFNKRIRKINGLSKDYRNDKIVNQFLDRGTDSEEFKSIFQNLTFNEQKEFIGKSVYYFRTANQTEAEFLSFLENRNKVLEAKALSLNKIPLLNLIPSKELIEKREKIIDILNNIVSLDYAEKSSDISQYFYHRMQILKLSFEVEYLVLSEIKKL